MLKTIFVTVYLGVMGIYDWKEQAVPVWGLLAGGIAVLGYEIYRCVSMKITWGQLLAADLPAMIPGVILLLAAALTKKAGYADGIVLLLIGAAVGYRKCVLLFCFSLILISLFSGSIMLLHRGNRNTHVPYIPFIAISFLACLAI